MLNLCSQVQNSKVSKHGFHLTFQYVDGAGWCEGERVGTIFFNHASQAFEANPELPIFGGETLFVVLTAHQEGRVL